ncbi:MAG: GTPase Era [Alphaproteobacteria bacterium]|nr:MAG: GTPase Era [Alphaproteobacteria bacterium]
MSDKSLTRCGTVSLIGAPNAGKSTLVNKLVGTKVSIVTHKVQTTRSRVVGIVMRGESQIVLVDTPGIFRPEKRLDRAMVSTAWREAHDSDVIAVLMDAAHDKRTKSEELLLAELAKRKVPQKTVLILNKIDLVRRDKLLQMAKEFSDSGLFQDIYMVSALTGDGCDRLLDDFSQSVPEGPWFYDPEIVSDMPARLLAAEITREKLFEQMHQEIPYMCTVETESWEEDENGRLRIGQIIYVARPQHKSMILGKGGRKIKAIGSAARAEINELLEENVHLEIFIKVKENWMDDPDRYREWGLDFS